jgi:hypothetical protein
MELSPFSLLPPQRWAMVRAKFRTSLFAWTDEKSAKGYGREEFLEYFIESNPGLEMCPCCDENRLYSKNKATIRTEIDHFLPKTKYPHLACHPYNLVPVCHQCNSAFKGEIDPLEGRQCLSRNLFPYGKTRLRDYGRLKIQDQDATGATGPSILNQSLSIVQHKYPPFEDAGETFEQQQAREEDVNAAISLVKHLYSIPDRWHNMRKTYLPGISEATQEQEDRALQVMLMSETLVRRICQFLGHNERFLGGFELIKGSPTILRGSNLAGVIYNDLRRLLYYLSSEDQGKDPFAFAITWILAAKLKEEVQPATNGGKSPLVDEIVSWFLQNALTFKQRDDHVENLLKRLEE